MQVPLTKPAIALTAGKEPGSVKMSDPASTMIPVAPIKIQYGGLRAAGVIATVSHRCQISATSSRYSTSPTPHNATAAVASSLDCDGQTGTRVEASTDNDCVATTHSSQVPSTPPSTESRGRASSKLAGTPYVSANHTTAAPQANTAVTVG